MDGPGHRDIVYAFDDFRLDPVGRTLKRDGNSLKISARLFDTLFYLVEHHDRLVAREELLRAVWPGRTVEETSLGMAISSLRAALKQHGAEQELIVTAPGRGYRFAGRVRVETLSVTAAPFSPAAAPILPAWRAGRWKLLACGAALCVALVALLFWVRLSGLPVDPSPANLIAPSPHSVAVLPFDNMSGDAREAYFADGLSEELIDALGRVAALRVASRISSFAFRGKPSTITQIARQLNVSTVLEGSLRREGGRLRITVRLSDGATGYQMWSRTYDRDQGDMLALEAEIAEAVIASLKVVLLGDATVRLTPGGTTNPRALDAYLGGLPYVLEEGEDAHRRAIEAFTAAINLDPAYALAYAQRARARSYLAVNADWTDTAPTQPLLDAALRDAEKAVALAPDLGEAHAALAFVLKCRLSDLARAGAEYARAVELSPGNSSILMRYALFQMVLGHKAAAVEAAEHAAALDPLAPGTYGLLAKVLANAGRFDDALAATHRAERLPLADHLAIRQMQAAIYIWQGDVAGALRNCSQEHDFRDNICLAWAYQHLGRGDDARAELKKAQARVGDNAAYVYANLFAQWGQTDEAIRWLRRAYALHDPGLIGIRIDPVASLIASSSVYRDIEGQLGLPP